MPACNIIAPADALKNMRIILTRVNCTVGRYRTLIVLVGTTSDTNRLHNNLNLIKDQMIDDVVKSQDTFLDYCKSFVVENVTNDQRELFERLYAFYLTSIEYFMQLISKYAMMITEFNEESMNAATLESNINTGTCDALSVTTTQFFSKSQKTSRKSSLDNGVSINNSKPTPSKTIIPCEDSQKIEKEFYDLSLILHELHSSIHLSHWNIVPVITVTSRADDKESPYSSEDDLDPSEKQDNLDVPKKGGSQRKSKVNTNSSENKRSSVQIGVSQYYVQPRLLLKSTFWNRKRKIKLIVGLIIAFILVAIAAIIPTLFSLKLIK